MAVNQTTSRHGATQPLYVSLCLPFLLVFLVITLPTRAASDNVALKPKARQATVQWPQSAGNIHFDKRLHFRLGDKAAWVHDMSLMSSIDAEPFDCLPSLQIDADICLEWPNDRRLIVRTKNAMLDESVQCYDVKWKALRDTQQVLKDCFNVSSSHWYGGYEDTNQYWPFERNTLNVSDYLSHDGFYPGIGNLLERYFVSSTGAGIFVNNNVPLYFSLNRPQQGQMCFIAKYEPYPYVNVKHKTPYLKYTLCESANVKDTHLAMSSLFIPRPTGIPHTEVFKYPIWSTWAQYHKDINQSDVIEYVNNVKRYNFTCSQIEIDDVWTPYYGDYEFDPAKSTNATEMVENIKKHGCKVTVWVHPFFNTDGSGFREADSKGYLMKEAGTGTTQLTSWWDGEQSGLLDVSNPDAVQWFLGKLQNLQSTYLVDSFKFDAGETTWIPEAYSFMNTTENPNDIYPREYVKMAAMSDTTNRQEVRSGYRSQQHPMFVRQMDKRSLWTGEGSFETVIPGALTMGLIGYPFVLPDMVGGNAYGTNFPDGELYIRWIQVNTFLPGLQLSIVPWEFDDSVVRTTRTFVELHTKISGSLIYFANEAVQTGAPIIRPLWWIDPENETALTCGDEFLVGDQYLVAPIIKQNARSRDIYIPTGRWVDMLRGNGTHPVITGPTVLSDYRVELEELAYFENVKYALSI